MQLDLCDAVLITERSNDWIHVQNIVECIFILPSSRNIQWANYKGWYWIDRDEKKLEQRIKVIKASPTVAATSHPSDNNAPDSSLGKLFTGAAAEELTPAVRQGRECWIERSLLLKYTNSSSGRVVAALSMRRKRMIGSLICSSISPKVFLLRIRLFFAITLLAIPDYM